VLKMSIQYMRCRISTIRLVRKSELKHCPFTLARSIAPNTLFEADSTIYLHSQCGGIPMEIHTHLNRPCPLRLRQRWEGLRFSVSTLTPSSTLGRANASTCLQRLGTLFVPRCRYDSRPTFVSGLALEVVEIQVQAAGNREFDSHPSCWRKVIASERSTRTFLGLTSPWVSMNEEQLHVAEAWSGLHMSSETSPVPARKRSRGCLPSWLLEMLSGDRLCLRDSMSLPPMIQVSSSMARSESLTMG